LADFCVAGSPRVVAAGRNLVALDAIAKAGGPRVVTVPLKGDPVADAAVLRAAAGGGAQMAVDMVGNAGDPNATLAALNSLRRGGRLVLMGSMTTALPIPNTMLMLNSWEILGQFMYPASAYRRLLELLGSGLLDISAIQPRLYPLADLPQAMEAAAAAGNLEYVVIRA
jgi:alcohol dehydrogenase